MQNQPPTVGQSAADCGKSATDFAQISDRLWENEPPTLGKSASDFGEKSTTDFEEIRHRLWGNQPPTLGKNWLGFRERLGKTGSALGKDWLDLGEIGLVFGLACDKAQVSLS